MAITRPDRVWASDITYIPLQHGWLYLTAAMDLYSRNGLSCSLTAGDLREAWLNSGQGALRTEETRQAESVGATRDVHSLTSQHLRETPEKSTGLCPYPFPFQIWFDGDAVRARSASRRKRGGS